MDEGEIYEEEMGEMGCPKCGGKEGYTVHDFFSGWAEFIGRWDIRDEESPTFSDTVIVRRISKTAVCLQCGARVPRPYERGL